MSCSQRWIDLLLKILEEEKAHQQSNVSKQVNYCTLIRFDQSLGWKFSGLFLNSGFWGWLSIESQPQTSEFRQIIILAALIYFNSAKDNWPFKLVTAHFKIWISKVQGFWNFELSTMRLLFESYIKIVSFLISASLWKMVKKFEKKQQQQPKLFK